MKLSKTTMLLLAALGDGQADRVLMMWGQAAGYFTWRPRGGFAAVLVYDSWGGCGRRAS